MLDKSNLQRCLSGILEKQVLSTQVQLSAVTIIKFLVNDMLDYS